MDVAFLSRLQFALTIAFHYIFPPMSIGLGVILVIMEAAYLKTRAPLYEQMTRFWVRIFGLIFAIGVASGIVMEFQFGTNWSNYARFVGDVFGSALAAEGIFAFFLESGFLALLLFGWTKVKPSVHFISTVAVAFGAHFSAVWIVIANSWQQTPDGYHLVSHAGRLRAEIVDFKAVLLNPSSLERLSHTIMGAWQAGAWLVLSASAFYLLRRKHQDFARASIKIALVVAMVASVGQLATGHYSADGVAQYQPAKMAAFEGHYPASAPADMYLAGWVFADEERVVGIAVPGMLSWLLHFDTSAPVTGLQAFAPADRPPVNVVFQSYHLMIAIGMVLIALSAAGLLLLRKDKLFHTRWLLWMFVFAVLLPQIANQAGWFSAEVGRQPWVVYNLLRTVDGISPVVNANQVLASIILFGIIYALLFAVFVYLLDQKIRNGPGEDPSHLTSQEPVQQGRRA